MLYVSHTETNSFLNNVVVRALLPIKPTCKLENYNGSTFFHKYIWLVLKEIVCGLRGY